MTGEAEGGTRIVFNPTLHADILNPQIQSQCTGSVPGAGDGRTTQTPALKELTFQCGKKQTEHVMLDGDAIRALKNSGVGDTC